MLGDQFGGMFPGSGFAAVAPIRAQAVTVGGLFAYFQQPVLEFIGSTATVSFERDGSTVELESIGLESGATMVCQVGNSARLEGVCCGEPVTVCFTERGKVARRVRFVFR